MFSKGLKIRYNNIYIVLTLVGVMPFYFKKKHLGYIIIQAIKFPDIFFILCYFLQHLNLKTAFPPPAFLFLQNAKQHTHTKNCIIPFTVIRNLQTKRHNYSAPKLCRAGRLEQLLFVCIVVLLARPTDLLPSKATGNKHLYA